MSPLQLHQALVDAGQPGSSTGAARHYFAGLCQRLGLESGGSGDLKRQFSDVLSHLLAKAPSLACSWAADYVALSPALTSSDPDEAFVLRPQGALLSWLQHSAAALQDGVGRFLRSGPAAGGGQVAGLGHTAAALLSIAGAVQAAAGAGSGAEARRLVATLQRLRQATRVLQVLEQLQQQAGGGASPPPGAYPYVFPTDRQARGAAAAAPGDGAGDGAGGFGQQPLLRAHNADLPRWRQELARRRRGPPGGRLFLDDLLQEGLPQQQQQQQQQQRGQKGSGTAAADADGAGAAAASYPYPDVLACVEALFVHGGSSGGGGGDEAWHARLAVLLYYLLDGGWLGSAEAFAQGFQVPLTTARQWQCHYLLDAAAAAAAPSPGGAAAAAAAALDQASHLLTATACPGTPFRFVEALLAAGRPATALALQRARCGGGGGGSPSLGEAQVLLKVQLGCGLLGEGFCDMRRHCSQVPAPQRPAHVAALVRQLAEWALVPEPPGAAEQQQQPTPAAAAAQMQQQLHLREAPSPAVAAAAVAGGGGGGGRKSRQQQLCELPFSACEEAALLGLLRQSQAGGHLVPLYLLQRGRSLEALSAYADFKASPAAAALQDAAGSGGGSLLLRQLETLMGAAAAAQPLALLAAAATAAAGGSSSSLRPIAQGLMGAEAARQAMQGALKLARRGVEPPAFLGPLVPANDDGDDGDGGGGDGEAGAAAELGGGGLGLDPLLPGADGDGDGDDGGASDGSDTLPLLFGREVAAEAGPGNLHLGGGGAGGASAARAGATAGAAATPAAAGAAGQHGGGRMDPDVVPLLFGTPAPAAGGGGLFGAGSAAAAAAAGAGGGGGGFGAPQQQQQQGPGAGGLMTEAQFEREVLGLVRPAQQQQQAPFLAGTPLGGGGGMFAPVGLTAGRGSNERSSKRVRKTPL